MQQINGTIEATHHSSSAYLVHNSRKMLYYISNIEMYFPFHNYLIIQGQVYNYWNKQFFRQDFFPWKHLKVQQPKGVHDTEAVLLLFSFEKWPRFLSHPVGIDKDPIVARKRGSFELISSKLDRQRGKGWVEESPLEYSD